MLRLIHRLAPTRREWLAAAGALVAGRSLLAAEQMTARAKPGDAHATIGSAAVAAPRQREGTILTDVVGHFKLTGDRATFFPTDGEARYVGLENLNLERIAAVISDNPDPLQWVVSGTLCEYRGTNYLLITKAMLQNKASQQNRAQLPEPAKDRAIARDDRSR